MSEDMRLRLALLAYDTAQLDVEYRRIDMTMVIYALAFCSAVVFGGVR